MPTTLPNLLPDELPADPFPFLTDSLAGAWERRDQPNPNAMSLATCTPDGRPSARIVLCKLIEADPGYICFFTNYNSRKGSELLANPHAAATFHWDHIDRQIRLEGVITRSPGDESDAYYRSRAPRSRLGAWASDQSHPIASRQALRTQFVATMERFGVDPANEADPGEVAIERPAHWGGFRIWPTAMEVWQGERSRLHDRAVWTRTLERDGDDVRVTSGWAATRLQP